ncbi:hypothetical protein [Segatella maculosa]|uniref:hypothetical protein n=1 Tax=Segatella maculosa TaxID=439703 RepID=UPI0023F520EE|nr:hypothetical protein [Segatella maculosa]
MVDRASESNACRDARLVRPPAFQLTVDKEMGEQVDCSTLNGRTNRASLHTRHSRIDA